jgi:hypothetical protein
MGELNHPFVVLQPPAQAGFELVAAACTFDFAAPGHKQIDHIHRINIASSLHQSKSIKFNQD